MYAFDNEVFPQIDIQKLPRGQKKVIDQSLADRLEKLRPGFAVKLGKSFGPIPPEKRDYISSIIRKHWNHVRDDKPSISYSQDGIPQVSIRK